MKPKLRLIILIACGLSSSAAHTQQFFYPRKCYDPDSIFTELQPGTVNAWAGIGFRKEKTDGQRQDNWFSNATLNYVPFKGLEIGAHFNKSIPHHEGYSYRYSNEYIPYARYTLFSNGCFRYAFFGDLSYHIDRKRVKDAVLSRSDAPAAGFGVYKTVGRFFWLQFHSEFFIGEQRMRNDMKLVWKMASLQIGKKKRVNFNAPVLRRRK